MAFYTAWKGLASWEDKFRFLEKQMVETGEVYETISFSVKEASGE